MNHLEINSLNWEKMDGLLPAIIQNADNGQVLMLGYLNQEALIATITTGQLTLYSRNRQRVWRKGEDSGNSMALQRISADCDKNSLLIQVTPKGPACHLGPTSCFQPSSYTTLGLLDELINLINKKAKDQTKNCYTTELLTSSINLCAKKIGEDAVDALIAAASSNNEELTDKSADLIFHLLILLKACELNFYDVLNRLENRVAKHTDLERS